MKESARRSLSGLIVRSGAAALGRRVAPKLGAVILMGHRVSDEDLGYLPGLRPMWFAAQVEYLCRHYEVIPLAKLVECLEQGRAVASNSVVMTFDDGFLDVLENAVPILSRHHVTATVFLTTGSISSGELPWSQRLGYLFERSTVPAVAHPSLGSSAVGLAGQFARRRAYSCCKKVLGRLNRVEREKALLELAERLGVMPPRNRMLSWDDARALKAAGVDLGAHTFSHPLLANIPLDEARWEMEKSRDDLREELGVSRPPFAFPGGSRSPELVALAQSLGFRSAFQSDYRRRINQVGVTDPFSLSRIGLPNAPASVLEAELDGPMHPVRRLWRG